MLFASEEIHERRQAIVGDREPSDWSEDDIRALVELDPEDLGALYHLAALKIGRGEYEEAEARLWQAVRLHPCSWVLYKGLGYLAARDNPLNPLAAALGSLEYFYISTDPATCDELARAGEFRQYDSFFRKVAGSRKLSPSAQARLLSVTLSPTGETEPPEITARLRGYRLVRDLFEKDRMERELVDEILRNGELMVPFLVGVLRGWARHVHENAPAVRNAIALLGEIADVSTLHAICEMPVIDGSQVVLWAFDRMKVKRGEAFDRAVLEIAGRTGPAATMALLKAALYYNRHWPVCAQMLDLLAASVNRWYKSERNAIFPPLVLTIMSVRHREGVELVRKLLRENASVLSRDVRSECDRMLADLGSGPFPNLPEPREFRETVHGICAGLECRGEDLDSEAEFDGDEDEQVEPVHRAARPGRNDPCWCGSGKKYKKCHLDADEHGRQETAPVPAEGRMGRREFLRLQREVIAFMDREISSAAERRDIEEALYFPGDRDRDDVMKGEWTLHDWVSQRRGRTILEEYLRRNQDKLSPAERDVLENWAASYYGFYEVTDVQKGTGLTLKDMTSGQTRFVHDVNLSNAAVRWDGMLARVVEGERGDELGGYVLLVPRPHQDALLAWMEKDKRQLRLPWNEYLKRRFPRIREQFFKILHDGISGLQIQNTDGEELVFSTALYRVGDEEALLAGLRGTADIVEDVSGQRFSWLNPARTVLGTIAIDGDELKLECNSRGRLNRGKALLAAIGGPSIRHAGDQFTSQEEVKSKARAGASERSVPELPSETAHQLLTEHLNRHYATWPDLKLPALDNHTPREAMQDPLLRPRVVELVRSLENAEERKRQEGQPYFDVRSLMDDLGLKEHER